MRIALYQAPSPAGEIPAGLATVQTALTLARDAGADIVTLPELFLPGYNAVTSTPPDGWDDVLPRLRQMCLETGTALTIGLPEYAEDAAYNSAYVIGPDGETLSHYRKIQLYGPRENALFQAGDALVVFDFMGTRFGLMICYDIEFPEHVRALARAGAQVILTPTANMMPFVNVNRIGVPSRAYENAVTIVYANLTGSEGDLTYVGQSLIAGPDGLPLDRLGDEEGLLVVEMPTGIGPSGIPLSSQLEDYLRAKKPSEPS